MTFSLLLDSGIEAYSRICTMREQARALLARYNAIARERNARGDLVTLPLAVGIVEHKMEAERAALRERLAKKAPQAQEESSMTELKEIPPHVQRMAGESAELVDRRQKLHLFVHGGTPIFEQLPEVDKTLLRAQLSAMDAYSDILQLRLERALIDQ